MVWKIIFSVFGGILILGGLIETIHVGKFLYYFRHWNEGDEVIINNHSYQIKCFDYDRNLVVLKDEGNNKYLVLFEDFLKIAKRYE